VSPYPPRYAPAPNLTQQKELATFYNTIELINILCDVMHKGGY